MVSYCTDFRIRFLLKFDEVTDVKQQFYELKQLHNYNDNNDPECIHTNRSDRSHPLTQAMILLKLVDSSHCFEIHTMT